MAEQFDFEIEELGTFNQGGVATALAPTASPAEEETAVAVAPPPTQSPADAALDEFEIIELTPAAERKGFFQSAVDETLGALETGAAFVSGAALEAAGGIGGLAKTITTGPEAGQEVIESFRRESLQPRTVEGKRNLEAVGDFLAPVGKGLQKLETFLGDLSVDTFAKTGSPTLQGFVGAFGASLPTAALEILGFKGAGRLAKKRGLKQAGKRQAEQLKELQKAAPSVEQLKNVARGVYKEIDDLGARIKPEAYSKLVDDINVQMKKGGFRARIDDKVAALLDEFNEKRGIPLNVEDLDDLREVAKGFAKSVDPKTKSLGSRIIDRVDDFLDSEDVLNFPEGTPKNVGKAYRQARKFWGQARRSEKIQELMELAEGNRASFLQGVQTEFKQLIRSHIKGKGPGKYFPKEEIRLMQDIVTNKKGTNFLKNLAKLQITRAGGGSLTALAGPGGSAIAGLITGDLTTTATGVLFPIIGEVSNSLAVKLTKNDLRMADAIVRAGADGRKIAKVYFENVKKAARSTDDLAELLVDPSVDVSKLPKTKFTAEALQKADELRESRIFAAEQVAIAVPGQDRQEGLELQLSEAPE